MLRDKHVILKEMMEDSKLPTKVVNYDRTAYPPLSLTKVKNGLYKLNGESTQSGTPSSENPVDIVNTYVAKTYSWTCADNGVLYNIVLADDLRSISTTEGQYDILWVNTFKNTCWVEKHIDGTLLTNTSVLATQTNVLISPTPIKLDFQVQNSSYEDGNLSVEHSANAPLALEQTGKTEQAQSVWGTNLLVNSDFSNGTTGWYAGGSTISAVSNTLSITGNGAVYYPYALKNMDSNAVIGHTYYMCAKLMVKNSMCKQLEYKIPGRVSSIIVQPFPIENTWYHIGITNVADNTTPATVVFETYVDAATANGKIMDVQYIFVLDLTAIFGAGHEPTATQVDTMLSIYPNSWFDGKGKLTDDIVTYIPNSPSPDYPSTIKSVLSGTKVEAVGKNLFDIADTVIVKNGITCTVSKGAVKLEGTATLGTAIVIPYTKTLNQGDYCITSGIVLPAGIFVSIDNVSNMMLYPGNLEKNLFVNFTLAANYTCTRLHIFINSGATIDITLKPMLLLGSNTAETLPPYQPYQSGGSATLDRDLYAIKVDTASDLCNHIDGSGQGWCTDFIKVENGAVTYEQHMGYIASYNDETITTPYMSTTGELTTGATIIYALSTPVETDITSATLGQSLLAMHSIPRHTNIFTTPVSGGLVPSLNAKTKIIGI